MSSLKSFLFGEDLAARHKNHARIGQMRGPSIGEQVGSALDSNAAKTVTGGVLAADLIGTGGVGTAAVGTTIAVGQGVQHFGQMVNNTAKSAWRRAAQNDIDEIRGEKLKQKAGYGEYGGTPGGSVELIRNIASPEPRHSSGEKTINVTCNKTNINSEGTSVLCGQSNKIRAGQTNYKCNYCKATSFIGPSDKTDEQQRQGIGQQQNNDTAWLQTFADHARPSMSGKLEPGITGSDFTRAVQTQRNRKNQGVGGRGRGRGGGGGGGGGGGWSGPEGKSLVNIQPAKYVYPHLAYPHGGGRGGGGGGSMGEVRSMYEGRAALDATSAAAAVRPTHLKTALDFFGMKPMDPFRRD